MNVEKIFEGKTNKDITEMLAHETVAFVGMQPGLMRDGRGLVVSYLIVEATRRGIIVNDFGTTNQEVTNE